MEFTLEPERETRIFAGSSLVSCLSISRPGIPVFWPIRELGNRIPGREPYKRETAPGKYPGLPFRLYIFAKFSYLIFFPCRFLQSFQLIILSSLFITMLIWVAAKRLKHEHLNNIHHTCLACPSGSEAGFLDSKAERFVYIGFHNLDILRGDSGEDKQVPEMHIN